MTAETQVRIVIADDHPVFRVALRTMLESEAGIVVCGQAGDSAAAVTEVLRWEPDLLLLDLAMPGGSGLEVLRLLADQPLPTRTIVLTADISRVETIQAVQLGARGVVLKTAASDVLFESIRAVLDGQFWLGTERLPDQDSSLRRALSPEGADPPQADFNLTAREREILSALVEGLNNRDIAERFGISEVTVKHHLASMFDKCGASNRLELALFALRKALVRL